MEILKDLLEVSTSGVIEIYLAGVVSGGLFIFGINYFTSKKIRVDFGTRNGKR